MGCWNATCMISNLHIRYNDEVAVFVIGENPYKGSDYCYTTSYYRPCLLPFYGKYDDYGRAENPYGDGFPYITKAITALTGEEPDFDEIYRSGYLKISNREANMVFVHKDVFDHILENFKYEPYHSESYSFQDVLVGLPAYITRLREVIKETKRIFEDDLSFSEFLLVGKICNDLFDWHDKNITGRLLRFSQFSGDKFLIDFPRLLAQYTETMSDEELTVLLTEYLKGFWISIFMSDTRKCWHRPTGEGSQNQDMDAYRILIGGMEKVLDNQKKEYEENDDE